MAFSTQDEDDPAVAQAYVAVRSARGQISAPLPVPAAMQVLDLAFQGGALELLTGTAASGRSCCDSVGVIPLAGGRFGRSQTIVSKLTGTTIGWLTALPPAGVLATVGTARGVWAAQSRPGGRFAATRRLSDAAAMPWTLATSSLSGARTTVAWTATSGQGGENGPDRIFAADGTARVAPRSGHAVLTLARGHQIDALGLAPGAGHMTAGWIESWVDRMGLSHSQLVVSDLGAGGHPRAFSVAGQGASGVALAGDAGGDQVVAWKTCDASPSCAVRVVLRRAGGRFGTPVRLGAIDPYQDPVVAVSPSGEALVGWVAGGRVLAAARPLAARGFSSGALVSGTTLASDLTVAFGPRGQALAAWTQGTLAPEVVGALYTPR